MKIIDFLWAIHKYIVSIMEKSWIIENIFIAKVSEIEENGDIVTYDCIYCTILRVAVVFLIIGILIGTQL